MLDFKTYWLAMSVAERKAFAARCRSSYNYLNLYAFGQKERLGESVAIAIERETRLVPLDGEFVTVEQLRPDVDWAVIRGTWCSKAEALQ